MDVLPGPSGKDAIYAVSKGLISSFPIVGAPVTELLSLIFSSALEKRRTEFLNELASNLKLLEARSINLETLGSNQIFIDTVLTATTIALKTSDKEKIKALQNAIFNTGNVPLPENPTVLK